MKRLLTLAFLLLAAMNAYSQFTYDFTSVVINAEKNPQIRIEAENLAVSRGLPYEIYLKDIAMIRATCIDNGKIVYAVITNFHNPYDGGYCAYFEDIQKTFDFSKARLTYGDRVTDNTGEQIILSKRRVGTKLYLIPCMTSSRRNVFAFDYDTGDLVDTAFVPYSSPILQTPRKVLQISRSRIIIADQLSDVVQLFDTSGAYIQVFAPAGGLNNSILDNIRDMEFRANGNLLVTNAGTVGNSYNTVQQFSSSGNFLNTFISDSLNSPYNLLTRSNDLLVSNSSGIHNVGRYNKSTGAYLGDFLNSKLNFPQQMIELPGAKIALVELSGVLAGIRVYDSVGVIQDTFKAVTGQRGIWKLPNGNWLTTNSVGVYEQSGTTGAVVRTIVSGYNFNCISVFDPNMVTVTNENTVDVPSGYKLFGNYPNPFNPSTKIKFAMPVNGNIKISVYDILGKEVRVLFEGTKPAGTHELIFDAKDLPGGVYFCRMQTDKFTETKKMLLIK